jgi:hypothetical protein
MKKFGIFLVCFLIFATLPAKAQILKNLARKAQQAAERTISNRVDRETEKTVDRAMDTILGQPEASGPDANGGGDYNTAKNINTEPKRAFYKYDVVIHTVNEKNETTDTYFDADELASKGISSKSETPIYTDSEAFQYGYNEHRERWEKTGLMRSDAMSFMMPMLSMSTLDLPEEPTLKATEDFKDNGMLLNTFLIVEWVFIYSPDDFRSDDYIEKQVPCGDGENCPAFYSTDPEHEGTYFQFDSQGRLSFINAKANTQMAQGEGTFDFDYDTPVSVTIPNAVEVKSPMQDILMKGLDVDEH